jgi:hypothetical protein
VCGGSFFRACPHFSPRRDRFFLRARKLIPTAQPKFANAWASNPLLTPALSPLAKGERVRELKGVGFLLARLPVEPPSKAFLLPCERDAPTPSTRCAGNAGVPPANPTTREKTYPFKPGVRATKNAHTLHAANSSDVPLSAVSPSHEAGEGDTGSEGYTAQLLRRGENRAQRCDPNSRCRRRTAQSAGRRRPRCRRR